MDAACRPGGAPAHTIIEHVRQNHLSVRQRLELVAQVADAIQKREPQVAQSIEVKNRLEALAIDLLELSKTDEKALAIVRKYDIQRALPAAAEAGK